MQHLFVHAAASRVSFSGTHRQVLVAEFTPRAHNFYPLGPVRFHQEFISHDSHPAKRAGGNSLPRQSTRQLWRSGKTSVASLLADNCLLTWTCYRTLYTFPRALLLLLP